MAYAIIRFRHRDDRRADYESENKKLEIWLTFLGTYSIYLPMHYLGFLGVPRRYFANGPTEFMPDSVGTLNIDITIAALIVGATQLIFIFNLVYSYFRGKQAGPNPWEATSLEWQTPDTPPKHGNLGPELPVVYRWAYDYSVPGAQTISFHKTTRLTKPRAKHTRQATPTGRTSEPDSPSDQQAMGNAGVFQS